MAMTAMELQVHDLVMLPVIPDQAKWLLVTKVTPFSTFDGSGLLEVHGITEYPDVMHPMAVCKVVRPLL